MKILFITSTRIGDAVLSTGLLAWLVERHPGARITIACGPLAAPIFAAVPGLERIVVLRKRAGNLHWLTLWRACAAARWDLVVDLRRSLLPWLLWARQRRRLPGSRPSLHQVALLGRTFDLDPPPAPRLWTAPRHDGAAAHLLAGAAPVLAVAPGGNWPAKVWPAARFAALARRLTGPGAALAGCRVVVACGPGEEALARPVLEAVAEGHGIPLLGADLLVAFAVLRRAALFVGNDSGLMHMAAAAGIPTLGLFGPTSERTYGPWGPRSAVVRTEEGAGELMARAGQGTSGSLMDSLTVEAVERAALALYRQAQDGEPTGRRAGSP